MAWSKVISSLVGLVALFILVSITAVEATPLDQGSGPFIEEQGVGLSLAAAGVGLQDLNLPGGGTGTISIGIGGPVVQAILYWQGRDFPCPVVDGECVGPIEPFLDQVLQFGPTGSLTTLEGTITGSETQFPPSPVNNVGYRADVTTIVSTEVGAGGGLFSFDIEDGDTSSNFSIFNGAGLLVLYNDPAELDTFKVIVFDGLDFAFQENGQLPAALITEPVDFGYVAEGADRSANLIVFVGDANAGFGDAISITDISGVTLVQDQLDSSDGNKFDVDNLNITIPALSDTTTVQIISGPNSPLDSLAWQVGALRLPIAPPANPAIDIEKLVRGEPVPTDDLCNAFGKPQKLTMRYNGEGEVQMHSQDASKVSVIGDPAFASPVRILATNKSDPNDGGADVFFDGIVILGDTFDIDSLNAGKDALKSNTFVHVFGPNPGDAQLQFVNFHTSCSQDLFLGNQFGSLLLTGFLDKDGDGSVLPVIVPGDDGVDADTEATALEIALTDKVIWTYLVTNPGDVALSNVAVIDDNETPLDATDDFSPDPVLDNGFNVGDTNQDGLLDPGEEWRYMAMEIVSQSGLHTNIGKVTGEGNGQIVMDDDPANYVVLLPPTDQCDGSKPQALLMAYTGDGDDATSHSQDSKKVTVVGDPADASPVRIIATDKKDPNDSKAKIYFDGQVVLNGTFAIDATVVGSDQLRSNTYVFVFDLSDVQLQSVNFHTSCSQPLFLGDQFGSAQLVGFTAK